MKQGDIMVGTFLNYFVIFFVIARLVSQMGKISWLPLKRTTTGQDAILAIIFSLIVVLLSG